MSRKPCIVAVLLAIAFLTAAPREAAARVRLENICTIYGQREIKLTGIGLVVGLNGTGDGGKNLPAMRALAQALKLMNSPVTDLKELNDAKNVAMVLIEATIPRSGLRVGQKIDCYVSSTMGAKSLRGGRLMAAPVEEVDIRNDTVVGVASGPVLIEESDVPTSGRIPGGLVLHKNFPALFIDRERGHVITLLLDPSHASFQSASEVAQAINYLFEFESKMKIAKAVASGTVEVVIPEQYRDSPVEFVAAMLNVGVENPHTQARVVVNPKTGVVIVTGEVAISPVVISHKNLTVQVGGPDPRTPLEDPFVTLDDKQTGQPPQHLEQLVEALNQLRVPNSDIISIIRELHHSGKLHAQYIEH